MALAVTCTFVLGGCGVSDIKPSASATGETNPLQGAETGFPKELKKFYQQKVEFKPCQEPKMAGYSCATVSVPKDYSAPDGETFSIAIAKAPATGKNKKGTLFINPGGPGGSGLSLLSNSQGMISSSVFENFDVVGFDPRGVGASNPVYCFTDAERDRFLAETVNMATPEGLALEQQRTRQMGQGCEKLSGDVFKHVSTDSVARDLDIMREVLGDNKLSYLGYSYGSFLGQTYAKLFPERVGRLVLDGILDGSMSYQQVASAQAQGFEESLQHYAQWCTEQSGCPWSSMEQGMEAFKRLFARTEANAIPTDDPKRPLTGALAQSAVIGLMYREQLYGTLHLALASALEKGNGTDLLSLADQVNYRESNGTYSLNSPDAFTAINALDYPVDGTPSEWDKEAAELRKKFPVMGQFMGGGEYLLQAWPVHSTNKREPLHLKTPQPILLLGNTHDPATPYSMAVSVHKQLLNSRLVTWDSYTHTAYGAGSSCVGSIVDSYLIDGIIPDADVDCKQG